LIRIGALAALLAGATTLAVLNLGNAQTPGRPDTRTPQAYQPSVGDLMTIAVQPRHIKLGLAGQEKNWTYAAYELRELHGAFERIAQAVPTYRSMNMADLITATTKAPMEDVAAAVKSGDAAKFAEAYAQLTATCNACHQSTEHSAVVIQVPKASAYPDQDFRPPKP
jgi:hypothetical protein